MAQGHSPLRGMGHTLLSAPKLTTHLLKIRVGLGLLGCRLSNLAQSGSIAPKVVTQSIYSRELTIALPPPKALRANKRECSTAASCEFTPHFTKGFLHIRFKLGMGNISNAVASNKDHISVLHPFRHLKLRV